MTTICNSQQLSRFIDALPGIVFYCSDPDERTMDYVSEGCLQLTGYCHQELTTVGLMSYSSLIHAQDRPIVQQVTQAAVEDRQPYSVEYRICTKAGQERWLWEQGQVMPLPGGGLTGFITDITAIKEQQARLQRDAFYDPLTALPNRSLFMDRLKHLVQRSQRGSSHRFAVLFLDLDRFKVINDSLGHSIGDQLLIAVAQKLQKLLRPGDTVARLGGDEFTMLVNGIATKAEVVRVCDRILREMAIPYTLDGRDVFSTTSIGIALSSERYSQPEELLRDADIALYYAKASGKACYVLFNTAMHLKAVARLDLETDLRQAIEKQDLQLNYQPISSLETGNIEGFEALVSWKHPQQGHVGPDAFLPVAEETGLIVPLGHWVLREACTRLRQWQQNFPHAQDYFITVNLSSRELCHRDLVSHLQVILAETQLSAHCLKLEITESTILDKSEFVLTRLAELQKLGIQLCIDDFGTGYSSLSYLQSFPISFLKVDRSFISQLETKENLEIVRTILHLAETLNLQVVAEGVETINQLLQLRALNCQHGQGYFLARPLASPQIEALLEKEELWYENSGCTVSLPQLIIGYSSGSSQLLLAGRTTWTVGRASNNDIVLPDRMVSRNHAMLLQLLRTGNFYFVDLWSRNGSGLNGQRVYTPQLLKDGDLIQVGKTELKFRLAPSVSNPKLQHLSAKSVLLIQTSHTQGDIWQHLLTAQGMEVLRQMADIQVVPTLEQLKVCEEHLPDLLIIDLTTLEPNVDVFIDWYRPHAHLPLILTHAPQNEPGTALKELMPSHIVEIMSHFPDHDLLVHQANITAKLKNALRLLDYTFIDDLVLDKQLHHLQALLNNRTLH
jgi:diguanylate cyclase (GGDEF)-like protein/PAS domain S-box-containing protein